MADTPADALRKWSGLEQLGLVLAVVLAGGTIGGAMGRVLAIMYRRAGLPADSEEWKAFGAVLGMAFGVAAAIGVLLLG